MEHVECNCRVRQCEKDKQIREERGSRYGNVYINHASIGEIWAGILLQAQSSGRWAVGQSIPPEIVCLMMVGVKLSREAYRHTDDNIVDGKIYLDFVDEMSGEINDQDPGGMSVGSLR